VPIDPGQRRRLGRTSLSVTALGFGSAPIGGLYRAIEDADAIATVRHAWDLGIRFFDTAPLYGYGAAERRIGAALAGERRHDFVLSTKVGRLVVEPGMVPAGAEIDPQRLDGRDDGSYAGVGGRKIVFDFSGDGIRRSIDASLGRLGLERIDIALIHDPDNHWDAAIGEAFPALARLREDGVIGAIGAGMNQAEMLTRFAREGDFDVFLVAGRYTLLDHDAVPELLPECLARGIGVVVGGVLNSGILADPRPGSRFNYSEAAPAVVERAARLAAVCERYGVPLKAAAVQFPLAHPAVATVLAGARSVEHLDEFPRLLAQPIPADLWAELRHEGLLPADVPTPS